MNYDEMPAGEEMDRLVAEGPMGWTWVQPPQWDYDGPLPQQGKVLVPPGFNTKGWDWPPKGVIPVGFFSNGFKPSTNIAHAWEVVEHMTCTTKETWEFHSATTLHTAIFEFDGGRDCPWKPGQYVGDALSMPLAICRAALKAYETK